MHHLRQDFRRAGCRTDRGDYLGGAVHESPRLTE
ncbi:hypothetical protein BPC006_I0830 [Burkholderia pseudomallei BPC006]|nr:hypothetical protein BPC006_I0830 [Burkholderia pseudomallei BPC006]